MAEINDVSVTDASNTDADYGFPEGMFPSAVNDNLRALMGIIARWHKDTNASVNAGGTGDVITVAANQTLSAYYDGLVIAFNATAANTGATTLNVDSVGAKKVLKHFDTALVANDIKSGQKVIVVYDSDGDSASGAWQMVGPLGNAGVLAANNLSDLDSAATARTNLGLGDAATKDVDTAGGVQGYDADTAKLDVVQSWTKPQRVGSTALSSSSGSVAVDLSAAQNFTLTLTENTTLAQPSNATAGQGGVIWITQNDSAAKTLAFHADWHGADGTIGTVSTTLSSLNALVYEVTPAGKILAKMLTDIKQNGT